MEAKMKQRIAKWIYNNLGDDEGMGFPSPPGTAQVLEFGPMDGNKNDPDSMRPMYVATTYNNDGFELWLGGRNHWDTFYNAEYARQLAWFILWTWWAKGTWFGLKRKLWYWALRAKNPNASWLKP